MVIAILFRMAHQKATNCEGDLNLFQGLIKMYFHAMNVKTILNFNEETWVEQSRKIHKNSA